MHFAAPEDQHLVPWRQLAGMSRLPFVLIVVFASAVPACGGPAKPPPSPSPPAGRTLADLVPMCQRVFARKQACADDYLPVLLDLRIELNLPPGIADQVKAEGRDAALVRAHTELARDTQPENVNPLCEAAAEQAKKSPPEHVDKLLALGARCEAAADCKAYAACVVDMDRMFIRTGPRYR